MGSNALFLTGNTDTVYALGFLDLKKDGPTVVETPAGAGPGTLNDAFFRFVIDMGAPGPDGYFTAKSPSYVNWLALRGFLVDGKTNAADKDERRFVAVAARSRQQQLRYLGASAAVSQDMRLSAAR